MNGLRSLVSAAQDYLNGRVEELTIGDGGCLFRAKPSGEVLLLAEYVAFCYTQAFWAPNHEWEQLEESAARCRHNVLCLDAGRFPSAARAVRDLTDRALDIQGDYGTFGLLGLVEAELQPGSDAHRGD